MKGLRAFLNIHWHFVVMVAFLSLHSEREGRENDVGPAHCRASAIDHDNCPQSFNRLQQIDSQIVLNWTELFELNCLN